MALRRVGIDKARRLELKAKFQKQTKVKDISEYEEWKRYLGFADFQQIGQSQKK
jgi:hypothetical protein